jgi:hypothetical protein
MKMLCVFLAKIGQAANRVSLALTRLVLCYAIIDVSKDQTSKALVLAKRGRAKEQLYIED